MGFLAGLFAGAIAVDTIWFWLILFGIGCGITALVEADDKQGGGFWATIVLAVTVMLLNFAWKIPIFKSIVAHPLNAIGWVAGYYAVGTLWGFIKWSSFMHKLVGKYNECKAQFLTSKKATELTPALAADFENFLSRRTNMTMETPTAGRYKGDIIRWMTYWPFSIIGTLLNDIVRRMWEQVYTFVTSTYDRIAARFFKGVTADAALVKQHQQNLIDERTRQNQEADDERNSRKARY